MRRIAVALFSACVAGCGGSSSDAPADASAGDGAIDAGFDAAETSSDATADALDAPPTTSFRIALSVSPFTDVLLAAGIRFTDGVRTASTALELQRLYVAHGANEVFVRVATEHTNPAGSASDHSLAHALEVAKLARTLALPLNPELGLWSDYGDISCQPPPDFTGYDGITVPGAWSTLTIDQMVPVLRAYGASMAHAFLDAGTRVSIWDLGNEIDFGTAGVAPKGLGACAGYQAPDGVDPVIGTKSVADLIAMTETDREAWLAAHVWPHQARLLAAVVDGVRSVDPTARFATHVSGVSASNSALALAFYQAMADGGFHPDELGFSWYPTSNTDAGRVTAFRATVDAARAKFAKPVFIAELAYAAGPMTGAYATWVNPLPSYAISPEGQAALLKDLASWGVVSGLSGIRYWAPEVVVPSWSGFSIFVATDATTATARPAIDSIVKGLAIPNAAALHD